MGFLQISSNKTGIKAKKISETLIALNAKKCLTFFEIEIAKKNNMKFINQDKLFFEIKIPRRVTRILDASKVITKSEFKNWYYSQKHIENNENDDHFKMNGCDTIIVESSSENSFDKDQCMSKMSIEVPPNDFSHIGGLESIHIFVCFESIGEITRRGSGLFIESRYFDRKQTSKNGFNLSNKCPHRFEIESLYCWIVIPKKHTVVSYSNNKNYSPRDCRIIEKDYCVFTESYKNKFLMWKEELQCKWSGYPEVINWKVDKDKLTFYESIKNMGKWDEIRLYVSTVGFPLSRYLTILGIISSILGFIIGVLSTAIYYNN